MTIQYLQGLNIFVIMELQLQPCFARLLVHEASKVVLPNSMFFQQAHSWPFEKPLNPPAPYVASCLTSGAVPPEFHYCNDSVTRVAGRLQVPTMPSRDVLHQAKGGSS